MKREEMKKWIKEHGDQLFFGIDCDCIQCNQCPFEEGRDCVFETDTDTYQLLKEEWAKANGYVKKEDTKPKIETEEKKDPGIKIDMDYKKDSLYHPSENHGYKYTDEDGNPVPPGFKSLSKFTDEHERLMKLKSDTQNIKNALYEEFQDYMTFDDDGPQFKTKWDFLKDTMKVSLEQEQCISKKDVYERILMLMDAFDR